MSFAYDATVVTLSASMSIVRAFGSDQQPDDTVSYYVNAECTYRNPATQPLISIPHRYVPQFVENLREIARKLEDAWYEQSGIAR